MSIHSPLALIQQDLLCRLLPMVALVLALLLASIVKMGNCPKRKERDKESCIS